jgi:glycosyltransferase involved in cell wall biosynthesis
LNVASTFPLITIVIPTYNRKELLQKAINSVVSQTYTNWELIIVDDGSTDGTSNLIKSLPDKRIRVIELLHSGHIGILFNTGVEAGSGYWIAFLASDDVWLPDKLELQLTTLRKSGLRWCYTNYELMDESGQAIPSKAGKFQPLSGSIIIQLLTMEASVTMCSVLLERSLFEEVKGFSRDPRLMFRGDYELALRLALSAEVIALPELLVRVLEHPKRSTNGLTDGHERSALAYEIFLSNKPGKQLSHLAKRRRGLLLAEAATASLGKGNYINSCKLITKAIAGGAGLRSCLSAIYRGTKAHFQPSLHLNGNRFNP